MDCNRVKSRSFPLICATGGGWSVVAGAAATGERIGFVVEFDISYFVDVLPSKSSPIRVRLNHSREKSWRKTRDAIFDFPLVSTKSRV